MGYAIRNDGKGWRSVNGADDVSADETYSDAIPEKTNAQRMAEEVAALTTKYKSDLQALQLNWLSVVVADGTNEEAKKTVIAQDIADLKTKYLSDIAAVKVTYGG